jgi:replication fork protection complex subunit Tof1/Swi1
MEVWEKSRTVDPEVRAYVYSLVSAVGGQSTLDDRYAVGDDALAVLNDLVRWLRLYDEKTNRFDVKRCLAEANLVKGDLLEILALWPEEEQDSKLKAKLALKCLELLVPLTWPIEMDELKTTVNHLRHIPYLQLAQVGYKRAVLQYEDAKILRTVVRIALSPIAIARRERTRRDESIIRMILYFFRNVTMITQPQNLPSQGDENDVSRSATIDTFHDQDVFNLLLTIGSGAGDEFQERDVEVLEILFHLLKGVDARKLFQTQSQLEKDETNELQSLMQKEKAMLNSYNKHAPTRHNRFGTMIWVKRGEEKVSTMCGQNSITNADTTLLQMDASKKVVKPRQRGKQTAEDLNENNEFSAKIELSESARKHLRGFVEDFLDSSFNPLFGSLRKAIGGEAERVGSAHHRQFFYLISWFLSAEAARRDRRRQTESQSTQEDNTFAYIAAVLDQETFVLLTRRMQKAFDEKQWQDLQAILLTLTQILHTVQSMSESPDEDDREIAENIQNRIFYEEATHDLLVQILRTYKNQGFSYLDSVTECVHVFVRMLDRYSKQNADLQIRSNRRARRKRKENAEAQGATIDNEEIAAGDEQDEVEAHAQVRERKFDFARFSAKFLAQGCVDTFINLLRYYQDLNPEQLKRCHRYLYRLAFKHELGILLFRVDILQLFYRMIKGPDGLDPASTIFIEMETLVQQIFRRCIKWIERENEGEGWREAAVVEMLFSKIPGTAFYLQNGFERVVQRRPPRPPAELEVKRTVDEEKRVGVAVSIMLDQGKQDAVEWIKAQLKNAAVERQAWVDGQAAMAEVQRMSGEGKDAGPSETGDEVSAPTIFVSPDTDERREALFKDKYLRLLLTTLGLHRLGTAEDTEASWVIPPEVSAKQLQNAVERIQQAEFDPPTFEEGQLAQDLIRNKSAGRQGQTFSDDSESERDIDGPMFPPNLREPRKGGEERPKKQRLTRRNQAELTEEQIEERAKERRMKERERNSKIKSQLIVEESDDEKGDEEFFRLEEERRKKTAGMIRSQLLKEANNGNAKSKKKKRHADDSEDGESASVSKKRKTLSGSEEEGRDSSPDEASDDENTNMPFDLNPHFRFLPRYLRAYSESESGLDTDDPEVQAARAEVERDTSSGTAWKATPLTSSTALEAGADGVGGLPLNEISGNAAAGRVIAGFEIDEDDEDDEEPVVKPAAQRRRVRAGFIIDDSSDDE